MIITLLALFVFSFCLWAVFSQKFKDGMIAKHLLILAAITSALVILDATNMRAVAASMISFGLGIAYWYWKNHARPKRLGGGHA